MASITWNGGTLGSWSTSTNWTQLVAPKAGDDVLIGLQTDIPYTIRQNYTGTIASLTLGDIDDTIADPTLKFVGAAKLNVTDAIDNEGTVVLSTGQSLTSASILNDNLVFMQGGTLSGALEDEGVIQGYGTISGSITGSGTIASLGGTLTLADDITNTDLALDIEAGSNFYAGGSVARWLGGSVARWQPA